MRDTDRIKALINATPVRLFVADAVLAGHPGLKRPSLRLSRKALM